MNTQTDNTQNTAEEFRQAAKRLGRGAIYLAKAIPLGATAKRLDRGATVMIVVIFLAGKLAINILRYSMGIAIYGLIIWPYRLLVAPTCAVAAGIASAAPPENDGEVNMFSDRSNEDRPMFPAYVDNRTGEFTLSSHDSYEYKKRWW